MICCEGRCHDAVDSNILFLRDYGVQSLALHTVPTVETMSSPDTVITQSPTLTDEAYVRGKDADEWHGPAKMM